MNERVSVHHRTALGALWEGERPTAEDFIRQLMHPMQFEFMIHHMNYKSSTFQLNDTTIVQTHELARQEMTVNSMCEAAGLSVEAVQREMSAVAAEIEKLRQ